MIGHSVPSDFVFPAPLSLFAMIRLWFFGDGNRHIRPFRFIHRKWDLQTAADKGNYSSAKTLIQHCESLAKANDLLPGGDMSKLSIAEMNELLPKMYKLFLEEINQNSNRTEELTYTYLYKLLNAKKRANKQSK